MVVPVPKRVPMNPPNSCGPNDCPGPANCGVHHAPTLRLPDVFARFDKEARKGVHDTGRYRCSFYEWGQGPPIVFVHGLADRSRCFLPAISLLSKNFRCIGYDLPTGRSDGANLRRYTHADLCDDLLSLLDHLELRQSYLFGSSFGSTIVLGAMTQQPFRFPRLILQAPVLRKPLGSMERPIAWMMSHLPGRVRSLPWREKLLARLHRRPFLAQPLERWLHYLEYTGELPIRALGRHARLLHGVNIEAEWSQIRQPVLLVCGEEDPICPLDATEAMMRACPAAGRAVLEGCGHLPMLTHPEALAELVTEFLTPPPTRVPLDSVSATEN